MNTHTRITRSEFYAEGGFSNPRLFRVQRGLSWAYYRRSANA